MDFINYPKLHFYHLSHNLQILYINPIIFPFHLFIVKTSCFFKKVRYSHFSIPTMKNLVHQLSIFAYCFLININSKFIIIDRFSSFWQAILFPLFYLNVLFLYIY
jgi:hypothetical protein